MNTKSSLAILAVVVVVLAGGAYVYSKSSTDQQATVVATTPVTPTIPDTTTPDTTTTPTPATEPTAPSSETSANVYKDGTYKASGNYSAPSGAESINITVTLKDDVITDATVVGTGKNPETKEKQADFIAHFKALVIGKKIDDANLSVVSGSSLTSTAWNAALVSVKTQAKA